MRTHAQRLADVMLGVPVDRWIADRRAVGASWHRLTVELREVTQGNVDVTAQTLRTWGSEADTVGGAA